MTRAPSWKPSRLASPPAAMSAPSTAGSGRSPPPIRTESGIR